jgi:predicted outer membrane repeat protein
MQQVRHFRQAVCTAVLAMAWATTASAVCYVNGAAGGANTGASWADAYTDLQSALTDVACTEVWVAQGVYKPVVPANVGSVTAGERAVSFNIPPGVAVYGGFAGGEASFTARDPAAHVTILSGDIDANDDNNNADNNFIDETSTDIVGSNTRHIVILDGTAGTAITATTVLDGFIVTGGDSSAGLPEGGGGLWCRGNGAGHACSPTLSRLVLSGNRASGGGAMMLAGYSVGASSATLTDVTFSGNSASTFGGAMFNYCEAGGICSPTLTNVTFSGNGGASYGGAMVNDGTSGGTSSPTLTNVTFSGNSASVNGGAIFDNGGGGTSSPTLTNVTFNGNSASYGGAMYNSGISNGSSLPLLNNVIMWGDSATMGGAESFDNAGTGAAQSSFYYAIIQGGCPNSCSNLITDDPLLGTLADNGGFTRTLMPGPGSPAINAVPCYLESLTDQRGAVRPDPASVGLTNRCDMGAVEAGSLPGDLIFINSFGVSPRDE